MGARGFFLRPNVAQKKGFFFKKRPETHFLRVFCSLPSPGLVSPLAPGVLKGSLKCQPTWCRFSAGSFHGCSANIFLPDGELLRTKRSRGQRLHQSRVWLARVCPLMCSSFQVAGRVRAPDHRLGSGPAAPLRKKDGPGRPQGGSFLALPSKFTKLKNNLKHYNNTSSIIIISQ